MEIASKGQLRLAYLRWALVTVPLILLLGFTSARLAPTGSENAWYMMLQKPAATPPDWAFPAAWTIIYILSGLALAMIINARGSRLRWPAIGLFVVQMAVNLLWSPLFFGAHRVSASFTLLVVLLVLVIATAALFWQVRRGAAVLLLPYIAWVAYAGFVLHGIDTLNPNAETLVPAGSSAQIQLV